MIKNTWDDFCTFPFIGFILVSIISLAIIFV